MNLYRWCISAFKNAFLLAGLLTGFGLLALPLEAVGQDEGPPTLIKHLRSELQGDDAMRQQYALLDVINLANCTGTCTFRLRSVPEKKMIRIENEAGKGSVVDLTTLIPDLIASYRSGPADGHRLLALSALINIGNEESLEQLIEEVGSQSEAVNRATQKSLVSFYLEAYPELAERTMRTRRLSLDDVTRAKALRAKKMKKAAKEKN